MFRKHTSRFYVALLSAMMLVGAMVGLMLWCTGTFPVRAAASPLQGGSYKAADVNEAPPGGTVAYTIVLSNSSGSDLSEVVVTDNLDARLTYDSSSVEGDVFENVSHTSSSVTFNLLQLKANSVVTLGVVATLSDTVASGTVITNTATISDPAAIFATNPATFTVSQPPAVQIHEPDSGSVIRDQPGETVTILGRTWIEFDPPPFPNPPVLNPIENPESDGIYTVDWNAVDGAANYVLQESADGTFENPEDHGIAAPDTSKFFFGKENGSYAYRVAAYDSSAHPSRWSNVQTVEVTAEGTANVTTQQTPTAVGATVMVSVSTDGGATWHPVDAMTQTTSNSDSWWEWSYDWQLGPDRKDGVATPLMARAFYAGDSAWSEDTITVTVSNAMFYTYFPSVFSRWPPIPYKPASLTASDPGNGDDYTVSWTYGNHPDAPVTGFELQEDDNSSFDNPEVFNLGSGDNSKDFLDQPDDTYWYRIRGVNTGWQGGQVLYGLWSDPIQVVVSTGHVYNFNTQGDTEGWSIKRSDDAIEDPWDLPQPIVKDGALYHLVWGRADFSILSPLDTAPAVPYTIKTRVDIVDNEDIPNDDRGPYAAKTGMAWGIIFGGNEASPCPADRYSPNGCLNHYYRILITWNQAAGNFKWQVKRIDEHAGDAGGGKGDGKELVGWSDLSGDYASTGWNEWEIRVTNDAEKNIKIYFNGDHKASLTDHEYIDDPYFGTFMASLDELGGVATKWDWFRVESQ